jgi:hypothetical protein
MRGAASLALLLALAAPAAAGVKASGYLKDFWQYSRSALDERPYNLNTFRARLTLDSSWKSLRSQVSLDNQVAAGSFFRTREFALFGYAPPKPWLDMEHTVSTGTTNGYGVGAYRAWVGWEDDRALARFGRQRIAWGTGKIWNPLDVLNPYDPTTVELNERRGVDAFYSRLGLGELGQTELVWAPEDRWPEHSLLARGRGHWRGWDGALVFGKVAGSTGSLLSGADFAGDFLNGTLHGELGYFVPEVRTPYWRAGLGWDYTFKDDTALVVEWAHFGEGATESRRYDLAALRRGRVQGVARNYAGGSLSRDVHPLLKIELFGLVNAEDSSSLWAPGATWNALDDLYLSVSWRRFGGEKADEHGRLPNATVLTAQWYF